MSLSKPFSQQSHFSGRIAPHSTDTRKPVKLNTIQKQESKNSQHNCMNSMIFCCVCCGDKCEITLQGFRKPKAQTKEKQRLFLIKSIKIQGEVVWKDKYDYKGPMDIHKYNERIRSQMNGLIDIIENIIYPGEMEIIRRQSKSENAVRKPLKVSYLDKDRKPTSEIKFENVFFDYNCHDQLKEFFEDNNLNNTDIITLQKSDDETKGHIIATCPKNDPNDPQKKIPPKELFCKYLI